MIIDDANLIGLAIAPPEDDPPLVVDPDRMKVLQIPPRPFQAIRWRHGEVTQPARRIDCLQFALRSAGNPMKIGYELIPEQCLGPPVAKGTGSSGDITVSRFAVNNPVSGWNIRRLIR
jgi:hypothetical protein